MHTVALSAAKERDSAPALSHDEHLTLWGTVVHKLPWLDDSVAAVCMVVHINSLEANNNTCGI